MNTVYNAEWKNGNRIFIGLYLINKIGKLVGASNGGIILLSKMCQSSILWFDKIHSFKFDYCKSHKQDHILLMNTLKNSNPCLKTYWIGASTNTFHLKAFFLEKLLFCQICINGTVLIIELTQKSLAYAYISKNVKTFLVETA